MIELTGSNKQKLNKKLEWLISANKEKKPELFILFDYNTPDEILKVYKTYITQYLSNSQRDRPYDIYCRNDLFTYNTYTYKYVSHYPERKILPLCREVCVEDLITPDNIEHLIKTAKEKLSRDKFGYDILPPNYLEELEWEVPRKAMVVDFSTDE